MSLTVANLDQIHANLIADFKNRFPQATVSRYSDNWKRLRTTALGLAGLHAFGRAVFEANMPDGATGDELDRHGGIHGAARKGATPAKRTDALRLVGTVGAAYTTGDQLTSTDGLVYQVNETGTIPAVGYVDVDCLAVSTGAKTRKLKGEILTFIAPPIGLQSTAELQLDLNEQGEDKEGDQAYRDRILDKIASPGMGGNAQDYVSWAEAEVGVATGYTYPLRNGLGTVDFVALHTGSGSSRALSGGEITALQAAMDAKRPVAMKGFRVLSTTAVDQDVEIRIAVYDDAQYRFDWTDGAFAVQSVNAGSRLINFDTPLPADLVVGDRLIYKSTAPPYGTGAELVVEAITAADEVKVTEWPANPPVAGNLIYSGGPLVQLIRADILAMFDALGAARGSYAAPTQIWEDSMRLSVLYKLAMTRAGVQETTIVTPGATVTPAHNEPNSSTNFLVPRQVIVRKA